MLESLHLAGAWPRLKMGSLNAAQCILIQSGKKRLHDSFIGSARGLECLKHKLCLQVALNCTIATHRPEVPDWNLMRPNRGPADGAELHFL